jgi:polyisoprenoid-binding protein YceI
MSSILDTATTLPSGTWKVDATHSQVGFAVDYMVGTFHGTFSPFEAALVAGDDGATLEGSAPVSGVRVQDENLAAHLQSPDFFDAERAPVIRLRSSAIERSGDDVTVKGDLSIRETTLPVVLTGTIGEPAADPFGGTRFNLRLEGTVDRTAFGLNWNNPLPNGEPALANDVTNDVTLTAELSLVKA